MNRMFLRQRVSSALMKGRRGGSHSQAGEERRGGPDAEIREEGAAEEAECNTTVSSEM